MTNETKSRINLRKIDNKISLNILGPIKKIKFNIKNEIFLFIDNY